MKYDYITSIIKEANKIIAESDAKNALLTHEEIKEIGSLLDDVIKCNFYMLDGLNLEKGSVVVDHGIISARLYGNYSDWFSLSVNYSSLVLRTVDERVKPEFFVQISRDGDTLKCNMSYYIDKDLITIEMIKESSNSDDCKYNMKLYINYVDAVTKTDDPNKIVCDYYRNFNYFKYSSNYLNKLIKEANNFYSDCIGYDNSLNKYRNRGK